MRATIYLIRHAESLANKASATIGQPDGEPLSAEGKIQAKKLNDILKKINKPGKYIKIFSSPTRRALDTAKIALDGIDPGFKNIKILEDLTEMRHGEWTNKSRDIYKNAEVQENIRRYPADFKAPGGESKKMVEERMDRTLRKLAESHVTELQSAEEDTEEIILVFTHGVAIKCFLAGITGCSHADSHLIPIDNTSITKVVFEEYKWKIIFQNNADHLK